MFISRSRAARLDTPGSEAGDPVRTHSLKQKRPAGWEAALWKTSDNQLEPLNGTRFRC